MWHYCNLYWFFLNPWEFFFKVIKSKVNWWKSGNQELKLFEWSTSIYEQYKFLFYPSLYSCSFHAKLCFLTKFITLICDTTCHQLQSQLIQNLKSGSEILIVMTLTFYMKNSCIKLVLIKKKLNGLYSYVLGSTLIWTCGI